MTTLNGDRPRAARQSPIKSTPRPRDRKAQIVSAARRLFADKGYTAVSAEEIAGEVGITAGALYRHFTGKQDLLVHGVIDALDEAVESVEREQTDDIESLIRALTQVAATSRELGVLWGREVRMLDGAHRAIVRSHFFPVVEMIRTRLVTARPDLGDPETELLTWSVLAVLTSVSYHRETLSPPITQQLRELAMGVCATPLVVSSHRDHSPTQGVTAHERRQLIVTVAAELIHRRGYDGTSMSDIGEQMGMTGGAIYRYFSTKADVLATLVTRAAGALQVGLAQALAGAADPMQALDRLLEAYIDFAAQNPHLVDILLWEVRHLDPEEGRIARRSQREYIAEWEALLRDVRPELSASQARVIVQAILTVVNDLVRTAGVRDHPSLRVNLARIGRTMLTAGHGAQLS